MTSPHIRNQIFFCHRSHNERSSIYKVKASLEINKLVLLRFKFVDQPPRVMSNKGGLTLPDIRDNIIQNPIAGAFARDIPHNT
jgi:hypothetical protein